MINIGLLDFKPCTNRNSRNHSNVNLLQADFVG
jgi:hypothetical protein